MADGRFEDYISRLPIELSHKILRQLDAHSLFLCRYVNRRFRHAVSTLPEHYTYERYLADILRVDGEHLKRRILNRPRACRRLLQSVRDSFDYFGLNCMGLVHTEAYAKANSLGHDPCFPPASTRYSLTLWNLALFMSLSDPATE